LNNDFLKIVLGLEWDKNLLKERKKNLVDKRRKYVKNYYWITSWNPSHIISTSQVGEDGLVVPS
jgi:hypothetical protein